jgi:hypothetical protein
MADIVDKYESRKWNGEYYCKVRFPDGTVQELKSAVPLNYDEWQAKITAAWEAHIAPPPAPEKCTCPACGKPFECPNRIV